MKSKFLKYLVLITLTVTSCSIDLTTKNIAKTKLQNESVSLIDNFFSLTYVENHAIAFGVFGSIPKNIRLPIIFVVTLSVSFLAIFFIWRIREKKFRILLPFFIILAGAYGNIVDRAQNGFVTDFLHLHYYERSFPVFNVADVLVNIGLILIFLQWKTFKCVFNEFFERDAITT